MGLLNFLNTYFLLIVTAFLVVTCFFFCMVFGKQKKAICKFDAANKLQEQANQQMGLILAELRRSNRYLSDLAGMEPVEYTSATTTVSSSPKSADVNNFNRGLSEEGIEDANSQNKLYVGNIDYAATESELADHFARFGQVEFVNIPINRYTGRARGFGFVTFSSRQDAESAMVLNGSEFKGRQIQVNFAKERETV